MIRLLLAALGSLLALTSLSAAEKSPSKFDEFTEADQLKLRSGETVVWSQSLRPREPKKLSVLSAILLPVPLKDAWAVVDDKEGACEYISDLEKCRIIAKEGNHELVEQTTRPPGAPRAFTYTLRHEANFPTRMDFRRESGDLRDIDGSWVFDQVDDGTKTLLIYALHIDAGMLVPQRLIRRTQEKQLPAVLVAIRERLAAHQAQGLCCTPPEENCLPAGVTPVTESQSVPLRPPIEVTPVVAKPIEVK
jgi:hypothetical protein